MLSFAYKTFFIFLLLFSFGKSGGESPIPEQKVSSSEEKTDYLPSVIYQLDDYFSHHIVVVEKSTHRLFLFKNEAGVPRLINTYPIATGKNAGNKTDNGDHKTPEGIYQLTEFLPKETLMHRFGEEGKIYGAGAFVLNYPNAMDAKENKTGGGIWLHSTHDESRISKGLDSRGCVVVANNDLKDISQYIDLKHTSMVIVQDINYYKKNTWQVNRNDILTMIQSWYTAWKEKDFQSYISYYHPQEYSDSSRKNYASFKEYKRAVFSAPGTPEIKIENISILAFKNYVVVQFQQGYKSSSINDTGKKILYLKRDHEYQWKIVSEVWNKLDQVPAVAFSPSMRFFNTN